MSEINAEEAGKAARAWARVRAAGKNVKWFLEGISSGGTNPYEKYLEHQRIHHPDEPVMPPREFWDEYWKDRAKNVTPRCC